MASAYLRASFHLHASCSEVGTVNADAVAQVAAPSSLSLPGCSVGSAAEGSSPVRGPLTSPFQSSTSSQAALIRPKHFRTCRLSSANQAPTMQWRSVIARRSRSRRLFHALRSKKTMMAITRMAPSIPPPMYM